MSDEVEAEFRATPKSYSTFSFEGGIIYTGEWIKKAVNLGEEDQHTINVREGKGTLKFNDGSVYEGEWKDDKMEGKGRFTFSDGKIYEGYFKNNQFDGHGRYTWPLSYDIEEVDDDDDENDNSNSSDNNNSNDDNASAVKTLYHL